MEVCCVRRRITEKETCQKAQTLFGKVNKVNIDDANKSISQGNNTNTGPDIKHDIINGNL